MASGQICPCTEKESFKNNMESSDDIFERELLIYNPWSYGALHLKNSEAMLLSPKNSEAMLLSISYFCVLQQCDKKKYFNNNTPLMKSPKAKYV